MLNVQIQNLFKVNLDDQEENVKSDEPKYQEENVKSDEPKHQEEVFPLKTLVFYNEKKSKKCFYCINMCKRNVYHDPNTCKDLNQLRPVFTRDDRSVDSDSESDDYPLIKRERVYVNTDNDNAHNMNDNLEDNTEEENVPDNELNERDSVIQHEGECCQIPRDRLPGRSLPGRPIQRTYLNESQRLVQPGDVIKYFTGYSDSGKENWLRATIRPMTKKMQLKHPTYYNVIDEKGKEKSLELVLGGEWKILRGNEFEYINEYCDN